MNWNDLGKTLLGLGLPTIGTVLAGPLGGAAGKVLADAIGVDATPAAINAALTTDPASFAKAKDAEMEWARTMAKVAEAQAGVATAQVTAVNETIRAEAARPDGWWGHWRTWLAYELVLECPAWAALIVYSILYGRANELANATGLIMTWWAARFGVLGVHVWTGSNERQAAITGGTTSVIGSLIKAVGGKR